MACRAYCSSAIWLELLGKVFRGHSKHKRIKSVDIVMAMRALFNPKFYRWIKSGRRAVELAYSLRVLGHPDMIDNILYAPSITRKMVFPSMNLNFKNFLIQKKLPVRRFMSHSELFKKLEDVT